MKPFISRYPLTDLSQALADLGKGRFLQQGWSPRCLPNPSPDDDTWAVLKTTAIQEGHFEGSHNKELPSHLAPRKQIEVKTGDILLTNAGPRARCGVPALVRTARPKLMLSGKMYRFRPNEEFDPEFLQYWLMSPSAQRLIDAMKTGISDSGLNLTQDKFLKLPVPAPSLVEQKRLVNVLEEALSLIASAEQSLESALVRTQAWGAASADSIIWQKGWKERQIGGLLREAMRNGRSDRAVKEGEPGTRTLTLTAVTQRQFSEENTKITTTPETVARNLWLEPGDILVQRSNTPELVGTSALYSGAKNWAIFPDLLIRLRANEQEVDSRFMAAALRTERAHRALRSRAKGLSGSMPKIDQSDLARVTIPVPPTDEQSAVVAELAEVERTTKDMVLMLETQKRRAKVLRASILQTAFAGELSRQRDVTAKVETLASLAVATP